MDYLSVAQQTILHIDFNSYFATIEQQANPRLRGKPIGITGGDRTTRTVLSTASIEAKRLGVRTGMQIWEAKSICPQIIIVPGDSDKYLTCTTRFLNILKDYSPKIEVFSIDESFLELIPNNGSSVQVTDATAIAQEIKKRLKVEIGEWISCSIGISYNKLMSKLASSLQKPDGLVLILDQSKAIQVLNEVELDDICGIGYRIKKRLFGMGIENFQTLRVVPKELLISSFKSYGEVLYNMARGIDNQPIITFYEKGEVKSIGHQHTTIRDTHNLDEIRQILLKISEMITQRLRHKKMTGKTIHCWYRSALVKNKEFNTVNVRDLFSGGSMQKSLTHPTSDGLEFFKISWEAFLSIWDGGDIRMIGASMSQLQSDRPANLSFLEEENRRNLISQTLDQVNNKFGDFTLKRAILLNSTPMRRKPNPFLSDRRFKI